MEDGRGAVGACSGCTVGGFWVGAGCALGVQAPQLQHMLLPPPFCFVDCAVHAHPHGGVRRWLTENKHLRYMWLPYTDSVVVVQCNPAAKAPRAALAAASKPQQQHSEDERLAPLRQLLLTRGQVGGDGRDGGIRWGPECPLCS